MEVQYRVPVRGALCLSSLLFKPLELELELVQPQMAQKPMLRGEGGSFALRVRSVPREGVWASADVQGAWVSGCGCEADKVVLWSQKP